MRALDTATKKIIDLSSLDPSATAQGITSGQIVPDQNTSYKVKTPNGQIVDVTGNELKPIIDMGGSILTGAEQAQMLEQEKFSSLPEQLKAGALGLGRGLSLGLSDVALTKTGLVSPEYLEKQQEYNPEAGLAGEAIGTVAPAILSGGESLLAKALSKSPAAMASKLGAGAMEAVSPIVSGIKSPIAQKAVQKAVETGIGSAVEGAVYGGGQVISEASIKNKPLTAESALAQIGTGALLGGLTGSVLGGAADITVDGAKKALSKISEVASDEKLVPTFIARSLGTTKKNMTQLLGSEAKMENITAAYKAMHSDLPLMPDEVGAQGAKSFSQLFDDASKAPLSASKITEGAEETIKRAQMLKKSSSDAISNVLDNVAEGTNTKSIIDSMNEAKKHVSDFDFNTQNRIDNFLEQLKGKLTNVDAEGNITYKDVSARDLWEARKSIDDVIYNSKDLSLLGRQDNAFTNALNKGRAKIEGSLEELVGKSSSDLLKDYQVAKKAYAGASDIEKLAINQQSKQANNVLGLTDFISGGIGGEVFGGPGAVAFMAGRKALRDYGDKAVVSILTNLERNAGKISTEISDAISGLTSASRKAANISSIIGAKEAGKHDTYEEKLERFTNNANNIEAVQSRLDQSLVGMAAAAPETAMAMRDKTLNAMAFLSSKLPKKPLESTLVKYSIPETELDRFNRYSQAVENPKTIIKNIKNGYISPEEIEVLNKVYPEIKVELQKKALEKLSEKQNNINYQLRLNLQKLLDTKQEINQYPQAIMQLQATFAPPAPQQQQIKVQNTRNLNLSGNVSGGLESTLRRRNS